MMSERMKGILAGAIGVLVAIGAVLLFQSLTADTDTTLTAPSSTTVPVTTTVTPTTSTASTTTVAPTTTAVATTTEAPTTTAAPTTTEAPFSGDTTAKNCGTGNPLAATITDVRVGEHTGYTRIVFDFSGAVPNCYVNQLDSNHISVLVFAVSGTPPYAAGIFDGSGKLDVGLGSVIEVIDAGMGGGSGEWVFTISTFDGNRPFAISTRSAPSRLVIDIGD
jgi:hypothetical protein